MEETLQTVYGQKRGLIWRGQCLQCCKMSNKVFIAKVQSFFEHVWCVEESIYIALIIQKVVSYSTRGFVYTHLGLFVDFQLL
jgi:hypothetical protein